MKEIFIQDPATTDFNSLINLIKGEYKGKRLHITIKQAVRIKSRQQIAYFHVLIKLIADECGNDSEEIKARIKHELDYFRAIYSKGEELLLLGSLASATIEEMNDFIEAALSMCSHMNIRVPVNKDFYDNMNY